MSYFWAFYISCNQIIAAYPEYAGKRYNLNVGNNSFTTFAFLIVIYNSVNNGCKNKLFIIFAKWEENILCSAASFEKILILES